VEWRFVDVAARRDQQHNADRHVDEKTSAP
jgi:hypothetical protein